MDHKGYVDSGSDDESSSDAKSYDPFQLYDEFKALPALTPEQIAALAPLAAWMARAVDLDDSLQVGWIRKYINGRPVDSPDDFFEEEW